MAKPIILPCVYDDGKIFNIMLKNEDIRKEEIIMKIITLMDHFLKKEDKLDLFVTVYNILPISTEFGFIEFEPSAVNFEAKNICINKKGDLDFTCRNVFYIDFFFS